MKTLQIFTREIKRLGGTYTFSRQKYSGKKVNRHLKLLREVMFVRAISALEVFLIENIKEIFVLTKEPFKNYEGSPSLKNNHILHSKSLSDLHSIIINEICRKLSRGGYSDIESFYKKHFNINLEFIVLKLKINLSKYYEDRHLLVHRLGKTDNLYRTNYDTTKSQIDISEDYMIEVFRNFIKLGREISSELESRVENIKKEDKEDFERVVKLSIFKIKDGSNILRRNYTFWSNDQFVDMKDIVLEFLKISETSYEVVLGGNLKGVSGIMKKLKQERRKGILNYAITQDSIQPKNPFADKKKNISLTKKQVEEIKNRLPQQPWPKSIHKKVALEMRVPNGQVSAVIQYLIKEGIFKHQIDGKIVED